MELTLKSVNGLLINDTTNFNAWFVTENGRGVYNAPDFDVTLVERAGRTPLASTVQQREKYFLVDIECRGIFADQWDNLKAYIFTGGSVPLVSTDKNGNDWTIDVIAVSNPSTVASSMVVNFLAPDGTHRLAKSDAWAISTGTATKSITTTGNAKVRPVFQITPTQRLTSYQERNFVKLYNPNLVRLDYYAFDISFGPWNTAALINDTSRSNLANGASLSTALTIPIDTPTGGGLFATGGICYVPSTGEQIYYTSISGGNMIVYNSGGVTGRGWGGSTAQAIADNAALNRSHMLKNGNDVQVVFGATKQPIWFGGGGINSTTTRVITNLFMAAGKTLTLGADTALGATTLTFKKGAANKNALKTLPATGRVLIGTEIFSYTAKTVTAKTLSMTVSPGQYGTTQATHTANDTVTWIPDAIYLMYGKVDEGARVQDESRKPMQDLTTFTNTNWKWDQFFDAANLRAGRWSLKRETGIGSTVYTGSHGANADPADTLGFDMLPWDRNAVPQGDTSRMTAGIYIPSCATVVTSNGDEYRYLTEFPTKSGLEKSPDGINWYQQFYLSAPSAAKAWQAWSKPAEALGASYPYIRFIHDGSVTGKTGNRAAMEVQSATATLDSAKIPQGGVLAAVTMHYFDGTFENAATGESFHVEFLMEAGQTIEINCETKQFTYLKDGQQYNNAVTNPVASEWMTFKPKVANVITATIDGVVNDSVVILYDDKLA